MRCSLRFLLAEAKKEKKIVGKNYTQFYVASLLLFLCSEILSQSCSFWYFFFLWLFDGFEMDLDSTQCESDIVSEMGMSLLNFFVVVVNSILTNNQVTSRNPISSSCFVSNGFWCSGSAEQIVTRCESKWCC